MAQKKGKKIAKKIGCGCSGCLLPILLVFLIMIGTILMISDDDNKKDDEKPVNFSSEAVLQYQSYVIEKCKELGIEDYANSILAIMYCTSKGEGTDVMGAFCLKANKNHRTITNPQTSIDVGINEFKTLLDEYGIKKNTDTENLKRVYQHYHIVSTLSLIKELPNGEKTIKQRFAEQYKSNYDKYTTENATEFGNTKINHYKDNENYYIFNPTAYSGNFAEDVILTIQNLSSLADTNPNNLGWIFPLEKGTYSLTSLAGYRYHPITGAYKMHWGIDYGTGTSCPPIYAVADGVVDMCGFYDSWGNYVRIKHNDTYATGYAHQSKIVVKPGQSVTKGQLIGYVGSTGGSTGNHLHLEVWQNTGGFQRINPNNFFKDID